MTDSKSEKSGDSADGAASTRMTRDTVANTVRTRVLEGIYAPGGRLPTAQSLAKELGASYVTILRGMEVLRDEGFITSHPRRGTFVTAHPPNKNECALVFPIKDDPAILAAQPFWNLLFQEARQNHGNTAPWRVEPWFYEVDPADPEKLRLSKDHVQTIAEGAIAGLIFPFNPMDLRGTPTLDQPGISRVTVDRVDLPGVSRVTPDHAALITGVLDRVQDAGCSRVAVVVAAGMLHDGELKGGEAFIREAAADRGLQMRPYDLLALDLPVNESMLRRYIHMMLSHPAADRPDALVLVDDHFVADATAGVIDAGLTVPDELKIFTYCNFPQKPKCPIPIRCFGYDVQQLLKQFVDVVDKQQKDGTVSHSKLQPIFEDAYS
jgi:hypothetical protein